MWHYVTGKAPSQTKLEARSRIFSQSSYLPKTLLSLKTFRNTLKFCFLKLKLDKQHFQIATHYATDSVYWYHRFGESVRLVFGYLFGAVWLA